MGLAILFVGPMCLCFGKKKLSQTGGYHLVTHRCQNTFEF